MTERNDQEEIRVQRRQELLAAGVDVYPARVGQVTPIADVRQPWQLDRRVAVVGRVRSMRLQGGSAFVDLADGTGTIQLFLQKKQLGEAFAAFTKKLDLGDFIRAAGTTFVTKAGEESLNIAELTWVAKALRPLPSAWHGLSDVETRYRYRELDTLTSDEVKNIFVQRSKILTAVRQFLVNRQFIEVETPMLHTIPGGATARPFSTHHSALDIDLFLRVAPELYLKRLIVGGFERVFEIGRNFRNEGIDRDHNPEFTMMECYAAFTDYEWMMGLVEDLLIEVATAVNGTPELRWNDQVHHLTKPFPRLSYREAILKYAQVDIDDKLAVTAWAKSKGEAVKDMSAPKVIDELFKDTVRPKLLAPTFVYDYPLALSPLAKKKPDDPNYTERFQILVGGTELGNAFSELNDPIDQRERFEAQEKLRAQGDNEAQHIDETYIRSLEYGMPPASGLGIGIDRLTAVMTGQKALKDVILFPTLKPETS